MANRFDGFTVREVLKLKKGSVRTAPLPPGFHTIRKLLSDARFDR